MYTIPVYLLVGIIHLFAKKNNYNIKIVDDPDFQIRVKRDVGTVIGDLNDREHIINMLKNHHIERMKRESAKYNFDQLNMPYTNGNPQIPANYSHDSKAFNPYATDYSYDKTVSSIVKRSDPYSYNKPTTNFDPFYNVKNSNTNNGYYNNYNLHTGINNYNQNNGYNTNNYPNNNGYYNNNPNTGTYNYNQNNGFYNIPNKNAHNNNIQLSYPNNANANNVNNANYSNNYYSNNNQKIVSNIQKIDRKNRNNGNKNDKPEVTTETSTITILESYIFGFGNKCPVGTVKIGRRCMKEEDLE